MTIIGIDPGTVTGWAVLRNDGSVASGTWNLKGGRHEGGGMRFLRLRRQFNELLDVLPVANIQVAYEEVRRHLGTDAAHIYGGVVAVISEECERRSIPYAGIPVGTVKKRATGKGNANKFAMIQAAFERWGEAFDENEADARWIAETAAEEK